MDLYLCLFEKNCCQEIRYLYSAWFMKSLLIRFILDVEAFIIDLTGSSHLQRPDVEGRGFCSLLAGVKPWELNFEIQFVAVCLCT